MKEKNSYIGGLIHGVTSLLTGMKTTMTVFCRRKDYRTISGKPLDIETLRPFPWHADHAP